MTPFRVLVAFVVLAIMGVAVIPLLSVDLNPREREPVLSISYQVPRSSPEIVEKLATSPLEGAMSQLSELKKINSISNYNQGNITLRFDKKSDMEMKKFEVSSLIRQVYPQLDSRVTYPIVTQSEQARTDFKTPILTYSVNGPFASFEIKKITEDVIKPALTIFEEVEEVTIRGANDLQLYVTFDVQKLQAFGFSRGQLTSQINQAFGRNFPGSVLNNQGETLFVQVDRSLKDLKQLENLRIGQVDGKDVFLRDVAKLTLEEEEANSYYRINGNNSVTVSVFNREGVNKVLLAKNLKQAIENSKVLLPAGFEVRLENDDTEFLDKELDKIYKRSGLSILILIVFIFLINRNLKYLSILFLGILINLSLCAIILYFLKVDIHLYSLAGLTISFGLIVDNAIIMIDHLHKHRNRRVFLALLAASLTTIAALMIVFFLPEEDQKNLTEFSIVVSVMLGISLLIALFFTPAFYEVLFKESAQKGRKLSIPQLRRRAKNLQLYEGAIAWTARYRKTFVTLLILLFGIPIFYLPAKWEGQEWYNSTIGSTFYQEEIRPYVDKGLGGSVRMFVRGVFEKSSYREAEKTRLYVSARLPFGNTLDQMDFIMREFEAYLKGVEGIDQFVTYVASGQRGQITITFKEAYERSALPYQLKGKLSVKSTDWSGAQWNIYGVGQGFYTGGGGEGIPSFRVTMKGYNFDELERQANVLAEKLLKHKRIQEVNTNERLGWGEQKTQEYVLRLNQNQIALGKTNQFELINTMLDLSKPQGPSGFLTLEDRNYDLVIREANAGDFSKFDLEQKGLISGEDRIFKITDYGTLTKETTTNALHKEDRQYIRAVAFEYMGSGKFGNEYLDEVLEEMKQVMPIGYTADKQTWSFNYEKAKRQYSLLGFLIIGIFMICAVLFENLKQPVYIIAIIPISFIGLFLIFSLFDFYFDQGGYAAFVMLGGLAVNAGIFIVNDLNNRLKGNYNKNVLKSVAGKAIPILLTILSTCFGLIPFIMEGQNEIFWFSLAIGTIGGLVFSMVGVFWALPVFLWKKEKMIDSTSAPIQKTEKKRMWRFWKV
ncbi:MULTISPECIES: efflux RND transporter permease subunit [unclassified Algoriphagus]|jgi:multidrug efflux pump subunit AcrB|uniref:efflux RND transporter permease subunit n=2 Tax=Algoriphagus TaxID=246875 RepID=UPI000C61873B|nr:MULTISPECIES: efflux RND transporter permease subunit [unclassified Algoriphagus]MAL14547.1 multidrug transporter [Algoriphagus sp.]HAD51120.1 multidrug transporter [Algoriphagus sp.]HAH37038.1 multidrug transporter [Algoriphagus sp.]HCH44194.1 multidrug transporter [Algoriphagus sp.]|tara:strand:+ start:1191 stop:4361 length:3171 start_codon:yes stop_codon:yes gene_type:complete